MSNEQKEDALMDGIDRDMLISRVVDDQASDADWAHLRRLGENDAGVWRELAEAQHEHAELCRAVESAIAAADDIDAPVEAGVQRRFAQRVRVVATWGGWAVAATLVLAWVSAPADSGVARGSLLDLTPDQAIQRYLDEGQRTGQVIEEIPQRVLIETRPGVNGDGVEVIFLRQFIERTHVRTLYRTGQDESGRRISVPIEIQVRLNNPL